MLKKLFMFIDRKLFTFVDQMKHAPAFQQILSPIDNLPYDAQTMVNRGISLMIPLAPSVIFLVALFFNVTSRLELQEKEDLLQRMKDIAKLSSEATGYSNVLVAPVAINTKQDFDMRINSLAQKNQLSPSSITVKSFKREEMGKLGKSYVSLSFQDFSTAEFTKFLNQLMIQEKVKIDVISLSKTGTLLGGTLNLIHFAKAAPQPVGTKP